MTKKQDAVPDDSGSKAADELALEDANQTSDSKPKPKPGDADYDWASQYGTSDLYRHTYPDGQVVALRRFKDIYSKQWLRSIKGLKTDFDIEDAAVDRASCDVARALIDNRPCPLDGPDDFQELWKAWTADDTGESVDAGE